MNLLFKILLVVLLLSTAFISVKPPELHNKVLVYNSDFTLVEDVQPIEEVQELPILEQKVLSKPITKIEKKTIQQNKKKIKQVPNKVQEQKINNNVVKNIQQTSKKIAPKSQNKESRNIPVKILTEQEELIAWNVWRSNIQNQIMDDVDLPILPNGVIFKFTFTVDKFGRVTNVQTWSPNSGFTPYAIQHIAPVIRSYQGKDILNFPEGSNRDHTNVIGGWRISTNSKLSTPQDYNDIEKVRK